MTEPSQYFKGRTVQEQMNEVIGYVDVRSAEVATAAIASDVAQVHQDMLDADADATAAAASAAAAAGTLANAVKKTGEASQSIAGDVAVAGTLSGGVVTGTQVTVPTPVNNTDAASKKYVDDQDALDVKITNINSYAVGLTGNQEKTGILTLKTVDPIKVKSSASWAGPTATFYLNRPVQHIDTNNRLTSEIYATHDATGTNNTQIATTAYANDGNGNFSVAKRAYLNIQVRVDGMCRLILVTPAGTTKVIQDWIA